MGSAGPGLQCADQLTDNVMLSETETMFVLDLRSNIVSQDDHDEYDKIHDKNKVYIEVRVCFLFINLLFTR